MGQKHVKKITFICYIKNIMEKLEKDLEKSVWEVIIDLQREIRELEEENKKLKEELEKLKSTYVYDAKQVRDIC